MSKPKQGRARLAILGAAAAGASALGAGVVASLVPGAGGLALGLALGLAAGVVLAWSLLPWAEAPFATRQADLTRPRDGLTAELEAPKPAPVPLPAPVDVPEPKAALLLPLYLLGLRSAMRQAALMIEKASEIQGDIGGLRILRAVGYAAMLRGQELIARIEDSQAPGQDAEQKREPFPLREDVALLARGLAFELGRDVALRYSTGFPAQALADRVLFRLALTTMLHEAVKRGPGSAEILIEASHEDGAASAVAVRIAVSVGDAQTIGSLGPFGAGAATPILGALARLLESEGSALEASADHTQLAFGFSATRYKRVTGTTIYGLGALSDRSALVLDPRPIGRVTICEQLATWRLAPTGAASIDEALAAATKARQRGERFDVVVVSGFGADQADKLREIAGKLALMQFAKLVSLEEVEHAANPTAPEIAEVPGLVLRRLARPPSPTELSELLTELLAPPPTVAKNGAKRGQGLSILLAEDNTVNQALMVKLLERRGHAVQVASNGADLVDRLWEAPGEFDAVLMDIQMPVMDGYEATAVIRLRELQSKRSRIPIIAVTAHAMGGERERCIEAGMDGYLSKPVTDKELSAALDVLSTRAKAEPVPHASPDDVIDQRRVLELAAGDMEFLHGLVELFSDSGPKLVDEIAAHISAKDADQTYRKAHQLKGSVGNFGADRARASAAAIEDCGKRGDLQAAASIMPQLRSDVAQLAARLKALLQEVG